METDNIPDPEFIESQGESGEDNIVHATGIDMENLLPAVTPKSTRNLKWNTLSAIKIDNFKAIDSLEIPLGMLNILVGPNGSGKSSVLQAIHWAARAASYIPPKYQKEVVAFDRLDYIPSSDPLRIAHKRELSSDTKSAPVCVTFRHSVNDGDAPSAATVKIWAARNKGGVAVHIEGGGAVSPFKQREEFVTAYIPGLAGLSERETIMAKPLLRRQAASGDAGGVLRNVLLNLASRQPGENDDTNAANRLGRLNELVCSIHPDVQVRVGFDEREDINIQATFSDSSLPSMERPLETAATGVLQVVQIFAYLILFKPKLLLVDEPDAHLHPDKQERLIEALESAAAEFGTQVIISTHSPSIVHAASPSARLLWISEGKEVKAEDTAIRKLLGWGGLDKKCIFFIEDEDDAPIRAILRQWPELHRQVMVCRCFGIDNLPKNKLLEGLLGDGGLSIEALIHRDRDFMTTRETGNWSRLYSSSGAHTWCTTHSDAEAYFCQPDYVAALYDIDHAKAVELVDRAAGSVHKARKRFEEKRNQINNLLYRESGGSPAHEELWSAGGGQSPANVLGKELHRSLKVVVKAERMDDRRLDRFEIPRGNEVASDLKALLETILF